MSIFQCLKLPLLLTNFGPENAGNCILESPILKISRGSMPPDPHIGSCTQRRASGNNGSTPPAEPTHPVRPCANKNRVSIVQRASLLALYIIHYTFSQFHLLAIKRFTFKTSWRERGKRPWCPGVGGWKGVCGKLFIYVFICLLIHYFIQFYILNCASYLCTIYGRLTDQRHPSK